MAEVAKYESVNKSDRVKSGQARAIREGKKLGRPVGKKDKHLRQKSGYYDRWKK
jgi:DNA invertase Pin-like site-specific DNA recombinase